MTRLALGENEEEGRRQDKTKGWEETGGSSTAHLCTLLRVYIPSHPFLPFLPAVPVCLFLAKSSLPY